MGVRAVRQGRIEDREAAVSQDATGTISGLDERAGFRKDKAVDGGSVKLCRYLQSE